MKQHDQEFEQRAREALDAGVTALDADTRRRLAAGRARALDHESFFKRWLSLGNWVPATVLAACAVLAVSLFITWQKPDAPVQQAAQTDQDFALELLLSNDDSQDAEADPDFYIVMEAMMDEEDKQHAG